MNSAPSADRPPTAAPRPRGAAPAGFRWRTLPPGTLLYRGTWDPDDWAEPARWFTDNADTAREYLVGNSDAVELAACRWAIVRVRVTAPLALVALATWDSLDRLAVALGRGDDEEVADVAEAVDAAGLPGWYLDQGDFDGADVYVGEPAGRLALDAVLFAGPGPAPAREELDPADLRP